MGSIYRENWKRGAKKNSVSALEGHDLVRVEDLGAISGILTTSDIPASGTAEGDILVAAADGTWTLLPRAITDGYVLKTLSGTLAWAPDASGAGGGGSQDLSASGFVVGPSSAPINGGIAFYDGTSGELIKGDSNYSLTGGGFLLLNGNVATNSLLAINSQIAFQTFNQTANGFTISINDTVTLVKSTATSGNLPFPTVLDGTFMMIKDADGTAGGAPITIDGGGYTIDGASQITLVNNYESATLIYSTTNGEWHVI